MSFTKFALATIFATSVAFVGCQGAELDDNARRQDGTAETTMPGSIGNADNKIAGTGVNDCPAEVLKHIATVDLTSDENASLFSWIREHSSEKCLIHCIPLVARRLDKNSDPEVVNDFCSMVATYASSLKSGARRDVKQAYLRVRYLPAYARYYFMGLRYNNIDIRAQLKGKIKEDWSFDRPQQNASTWHYYLYLASLKHPGSYEALGKKIASTKDANNVMSLLISLADLKTVAARKILLQYAEDQRRPDGPQGPGRTIARIVETLLAKMPD